MICGAQERKDRGKAPNRPKTGSPVLHTTLRAASSLLRVPACTRLAGLIWLQQAVDWCAGSPPNAKDETAMRLTFLASLSTQMPCALLKRPLQYAGSRVPLIVTLLTGYVLLPRPLVLK